MKLFRKKEWYTIITNEEYNFTIQRIAEEYSEKHKPLLINSTNGGFIYVTFATKKPINDIRKRLETEFSGADNLQIREHLALIV